MARLEGSLEETLDLLDSDVLYRLLTGSLERLNSSALRGKLSIASGSDLEEIRALLETAIAVHPAIFEDLIIDSEEYM